MLTDKGRFLVVKVKKKRYMGITVPVPIGFIVFVLRASARMPIIGDKAEQIRAALKMSAEFIKELQYHGKLRLVEVVTPEVEVIIDIK